MTGALVLVAGPSGAGKDTLIHAAHHTLAGDPRFVFARRAVTRTAVEKLEDAIDPAEFARLKHTGGFALDWEAHGLAYGLPRSIDAEMTAGRVVVANVSRAAIPDALATYPNCHVVLVTAAPELRAARLAHRGRESEASIAARLAREGAPLPDGISPVVIENSGPLAAGLDHFVAELLRIAG